MPISAASLRVTFPGVFTNVPDGALGEAIAAAYLQLSASEWGDRLDLAATYLAADLASTILAGQLAGGTGVGASAAGASSVSVGPVSMTFGGAGGGGGGGAGGSGGGSMYWAQFEALQRRTIVPILAY